MAPVDLEEALADAAIEVLIELLDEERFDLIAHAQEHGPSAEGFVLLTQAIGFKNLADRLRK